MACVLGRCRRTTKGLLWDGRPTPLPHLLPQKHLKIHGQEPHLPVPTWPFPTRSKSGHRPLCDSYCLTQLFCLTWNQQPGPCCSSSRAAFSPSMTSPCPGSCLPNQVLAWIYLRASRSNSCPLTILGHPSPAGQKQGSPWLGLPNPLSIQPALPVFNQKLTFQRRDL